MQINVVLKYQHKVSAFDSFSPKTSVSHMHAYWSKSTNYSETLFMRPSWLFNEVKRSAGDEDKLLSSVEATGDSTDFMGEAVTCLLITVAAFVPCKR